MSDLSRRSLLGCLSGALALFGVKPKADPQYDFSVLEGCWSATLPPPIDYGEVFHGELELRPCGGGCYQGYAIKAISADGREIPPNTPVYWTPDGKITTRPT